MTFSPNSTILYVSDVKESTSFYTRVLEREPDFKTEEFAAFVIAPEYTVALQQRGQIPSQDDSIVGGSELCLMNTDRETVDALYTKWKANGVQTRSAPDELPFGYTFVAHDPDGHALRVCATISA